MLTPDGRFVTLPLRNSRLAKEVGMFHNPLADGVVIVVILLLFFGPKRLPMLSRSIGESVKEFKGGIAHDSDEKKSEIAAQAPEAQPTSTTTSSTTEHTNV